MQAAAPPTALRPPTRTALVVVEEPTVRHLIAENLRHIGYFPMTAASATEGQRLSREVRPDLVLVDLDAEATRDTGYIHAMKSTLPDKKLATVMMSSSVEVSCGLDSSLCGATACISKPFSARDLMACVLRHGAASRRAMPARPEAGVPLLRCGDVEIDILQRMAGVRLAEGVQTIRLSDVQLKLLRFFMECPGRLCAREDIRLAVWGPQSSLDLRTVDQNIRRLRAALCEHRASVEIDTVKNFGYRFILQAGQTGSVTGSSGGMARDRL